MAGAKQKPVDQLPEGTPFGKSEASRILGVSRPTIERMIQDGRLKVRIIAGRTLVQKPEAV